MRLLKRLGLLVLALSLLALIVPAMAQASSNPTPPPKKADISFSAGPTRVVIPKNTSEHTVKVTLINTGKGPITLKSSVHQLYQDRKGGFTIGTPTPGSGINWVTISPATVVIPNHNQHAFATVTIRIPARHAPGQKYLAVLWAPVNSTKLHGSGAVISAGIVTPEMLVNTSGKVHHNLQTSLSAPGFSTGGTVPVSLHYANHGNVYSLLNKQQTTVSGHVIRWPGTLLLAGSSRSLTSTWQTPALCLPCHLSGPQGTSATVWVIPLPEIGGALAVLLGLILLWIVARRRGAKAALRSQDR